MRELSQLIYQALESNSLPPFVNVNDENTARKQLVAPLAENAEARKYILELAAGYVHTLMPGEDKLISSGFSLEEAKETTEAFKAYCLEHRDEIEALRIIYNNSDVPITYSMLKDLEQKLLIENNRFGINYLWNSYRLLSIENVTELNKKSKDALTNIIQLVRYAYEQTKQLESAMHAPNQYFNLWLGQVQRNLTETQKQVMESIFEYIASNGYCQVADIRRDDEAKAVQLIQAYNGINNANGALSSVYRFVFARQTA